MTLQLSEISPDEVHDLASQFETATTDEILHWCWNRFGARAAIGTSFQGAGLVMIDQAIQNGLRFPIFTLDTQFLFQETLELKKRLEDFFDLNIEAIHPELTPEAQEKESGPELWKRSPDLCCTLRKVLPLQKTRATLRLDDRSPPPAIRHAAEHQILELYHFDVLRNHYILKLNPMANWKRDAIWQYIRERGIPYNPLHDLGYRSIGCMQCTHPTSEGGDERAGRWTGFDKSECGIHTFLGDSI